MTVAIVVTISVVQAEPVVLFILLFTFLRQGDNNISHFSQFPNFRLSCDQGGLGLEAATSKTCSKVGIGLEAARRQVIGPPKAASSESAPGRS